MTLKWSQYQLDIFDNVANVKSGHVFIEAKAGSSKTTSLLESLKHIPEGKKTLLCAFNTKIADELKTRAPKFNGEIRTLHSLGYKALRDTFGTTFNAEKTTDIIQSIVGKGREKSELRYSLSQAVSLAQNSLSREYKEIDDLIDEYDISFPPEIFPDIFIKLVQKTLGAIEEDTQTADYNSMIYLPNIMKVKIKPWDYVFVDECFPYNQCIATENGKITIGSIYNKFSKNKDLPRVKTYNELENKFELCKITNAWDRGLKKIIEIQAGKRKIRCTPNHKFLTDQGWIKACNLYPGILIKTSTPFIKNDQIEGHLQFALNDDQKQIVLGSFLGDGHIQTISNHSFRLLEIHGEDQKKYCKWKADQFNSKLYFIKENGYAEKPAYQFATKSFSMSNAFFPEKKDYCPQWILDELDERGLAIWFMDDASADLKAKASSLWTCSFDEDSQYRIAQKLNSFGISCRVAKYFSKEKNKEYSYIYIGVEGFKVLVNKILPYIHNNISYKIPDFKNTAKNIEKYSWNNNYESFGFCAVDKILNLNSKERVFDIEVEKNHNFIVCSQLSSKSNSGLIVHNCQDLNFAQTSLILKTIHDNSRLFFYGDSQQNVYQFRCADPRNIINLKNTLNATTLPLSISYRCPIAVIKEAQRLVPSIEAAPNAIEGKVETITLSKLKSSAQMGCFILSRTNAPLIGLALYFISQGKPANIQGRDLGNNLLSLIKKSKCKKIDKFLEWVDKWSKKEIARLQEKDKDIEPVVDKVECFKALSDGCNSVVELTGNIDKLFIDKDDAKKIILSTVHRAKGLEREVVYLLDWTFKYFNQEEKNIRYVAISRSKKELYYVKKD